MLCIGHRGARAHAPENTLLSIRRALAFGAHAIEVDVHCCDGELVVIHDDTVDRTTNGHGCVCDFTLEALRKLDAGQGERIPLLDEVMALIEGQAAINIELKGADTAGPAARLIAHYRQRGWAHEHILVSSFDWSLLSAFRQHDAHSMLGLLSEHVDTTALEASSQQLHSSAWNLPHTAIDNHTMALAKQQRQAVYAYTANTAGDIRRLFELGVNGVFTDYPERVSAYQTRTETGFGLP